jgi:DNA adenine methylase
MLLYLNRTGYNGLFRLNAAGAFNVPAGRYEAPRIVHADRITHAATLFADASIAHASFDEALLRPRAGDVVYLDPPYAPLTKTANFRSYTARGFGPEDQCRLRDHVLRLATLGVHVVLSNSTSADVLALYDTETMRRAGLRCYRVRARRAINTNAARRGFVDELIVANVTPTS